jgi:hypothetical protein
VTNYEKLMLKNFRSSDDETFEFEETLDDAEIGQAKLWLGKDYSNCIVKDFVDLDSPFAGILFLLKNTFSLTNLSASQITSIESKLQECRGTTSE